MKSKLVTQVVDIKPVTTKFGEKVRIEVVFLGNRKQEFWLSPKQGEKFIHCFDDVGKYASKKGEIHVVLNDEGYFVWCGIHKPNYSELEFLNKQFGVNAEPIYVHDDPPKKTKKTWQNKFT